MVLSNALDKSLKEIGEKMTRAFFALASVGVAGIAASSAYAGYIVNSVVRTWTLGSPGLSSVVEHTLTSSDPIANLSHQHSPFNPTSLTNGTALATQTSMISPTSWTFGGSARATWNAPITQPPPTIAAETRMRITFTVDDVTDVSAMGLGNGGIGMQNVAFGAILTRAEGGTVFTTLAGEPPPMVRATLQPGTYVWTVFVEARTATGGAGFALMNADFFIPNPGGVWVLAGAGGLCLLQRRRR
jgi:hypothetical protein